MTFELKCNVAGQSYEDAIYQFRTDRNPKTRLFMFKAGVLVNFAMDLEQVYMTTKNDIIYSKNGDDSVSRNSIKTKERTKIVNILQKTKRNIEKLDKVSCFEDAERYKKYNIYNIMISIAGRFI